ncbi:regulator of chromosome condensation-like [Ornithodoros turicata]|uniref:regulator of chromosome condensation-like n=1 Tax=Ornithodoros turicata TaxID=34597 RepID=UPI0031393B41
MPRTKKGSKQVAPAKRKTTPEENEGGNKRRRAGEEPQVPAPEEAAPAKKPAEKAGVKKQQVKATEKAVPSVERNTAVGQVLVVGQGDVGQLGLGPDVFEKSRAAVVPGVPDAVDVVAGGMHTLCLTKSGEIYSFGCNDEGALGRVTSSTDGSEATPGRVDLTEPVAKICAGDSHSAALTQSGVVYVWGNFRDSSGPMGLTTAGGSEAKPKRLLDRVVKISSGSDHLAMLRDDGTLYTVGCAEQGQLGRVPSCFSLRGGRRGIGYLLTPDIVKLPYPKGCKSKALDGLWTGSYCTYVRLKETGTIYGFGLNNFHQLGALEGSEGQVEFQPRLLAACSGHRWEKLSGGQHHALLMDDKGAVYSMGRKEYGRLGHGEDGSDEVAPKQLTKLPACVDISCGNIVSFAVSATGEAYSWGMGTNGQLGHGDEEDVYWPKVMAGKALSSRKTLLVSGGGQHTVILATESSL